MTAGGKQRGRLSSGCITTRRASFLRIIKSVRDRLSENKRKHQPAKIHSSPTLTQSTTSSFLRFFAPTLVGVKETLRLLVVLPILSVMPAQLRIKLAKTTIDTKRWNICTYSFHPHASVPGTTGNEEGAANWDIISGA